MPEYDKIVNELTEKVEEYEIPFDYEMDVEEDDEFVYLEFEASGDVFEEFLRLGTYLEAGSIAEKNDGELYIISVNK